ncbi:hypothetical protein B2G71_06460 [Novosphingobium sp. PC22D]|uniref:Nmad3 family putative nucleotide modification protein n=1 Tax=Novosphingobium sp. PC22D TaxID=1962403 RepID=UPI000BF00813|nr:hypothetical protein [Novosphingobium sp. PC22D]PEQ13938.1 hypothetical protein B2G71_06460 [Novosphingobium sp. PC22D]
MKLILSRKGFDSTAGRAPSPIVGGVPVSLPIPAADRSATTYADRGLGETVAAATRGRIGGEALCHDDPMFAEGHVWFGQCGAAEGHLRKHGVGPGDVFAFFGLFAEPGTGERHHRIFGWLRIAACGAPEAVRAHPAWREPPRAHPHLAGEWPRNNALYFGPGATARNASPALRLTRPGGPLNTWRVPGWLRARGLSYHANPARWLPGDELDSARRGQEFVCDIGEDATARAWIDAVIAACAARG